MLTNEKNQQEKRGTVLNQASNVPSLAMGTGTFGFASAIEQRPAHPGRYLILLRQHLVGKAKKRSDQD